MLTPVGRGFGSSRATAWSFWRFLSPHSRLEGWNAPEQDRFFSCFMPKLILKALPQLDPSGFQYPYDLSRLRTSPKERPRPYLDRRVVVHLVCLRWVRGDSK